MSKIDVHHHIYAPRMVEALEAAGGDPSGWFVPPAWTVEADQAICTKLGVKTCILSATAPGPSIVADPAGAAKLARDLNIYSAQVRDADPSAYGFFASVPSLLDTERCLAEIAYALDELHADGVVLMTRYGSGNAYLGSSSFAPVWEELDRRGAVVLVHPTHTAAGGQVNAHAMQPLFDYPHETTRAAMDLIMSGFKRKYARCRVVLSHAGGTLPYLIHRLTILVHTPWANGRTEDELVEDAQSFYFDLALSSNPVQLPALLKFAKPGHILFGSDFPNAPKPFIEKMTKFLDDFEIDQDTRDEIYFGAARRLFPRLAV
ncbi:amidohydrolase family protein [Mycena albidolilacea]|uniref:6-methylsalicylate decarboxylase n=1 Tax=Mycena albidolilacea TaxID=1033008 RepID=A0AAD7A1L5_9AGAR|nr:amidohydrolase family protein [Mycena albidolilacea]